MNRRSDAIALLGLTVLWWAMLPWLGVHGAFPLNDDWAYSWTTERLLDTGSFVRHGWTWTPVYTNIGIGALFATLFGFCQETLRASGVFFGWLTVIGTYLLCRRVGATRTASFLGAAVTGWCPFHLNLWYTFMTDVPFTALCVWGLLFLHRGLERRSWLALSGGVLCAAAATMSRQPGVALLIALFLVVILAQHRTPKRLALGVAALALFIAAVVLIPHFWFPREDRKEGEHLYTVTYYLRHLFQNPHSAFFLALNGLTSLTYLGLLLAPIAILTPRTNHRNRMFGVCAALAAVTVVGVAQSRYRMPLGMNMLHGQGLGPITLDGAAQLPTLPDTMWWVLLAAGLFFGFLICGRLLGELRRRRSTLLDKPEWLLLLFFPAIYVAPLLLRAEFYDRYYLTILPPLAAVLLAPHHPNHAGRAVRSVAALLTLLLAAYAMLGTRDYLEHHRNRWSLLDELLEQGIEPERINGGFEFNGQFNFGRAPLTAPDGWIVDDEYRVSYAPTIDGYDRVAMREYGTWLSFGTERVYMHHRKTR